MKKILFTSLIAACAAMGLSGCISGDYDANPDGTTSGANPLNPPGSGGSGGSGGGGGTGGSGNTGGPGFNWSGTDPWSAKVDGVPLVVTGSGNSRGGYIITLHGNNKNERMTISVEDNSTPMTAGANLDNQYSVTYEDASGGSFSNRFGGSGTYKVTEFDAAHIKGYFQAEVKNSAGTASHTITDGYFNIEL